MSKNLYNISLILLNLLLFAIVLWRIFILEINIDFTRETKGSFNEQEVKVQHISEIIEAELFKNINFFENTVENEEMLHKEVKNQLYFLRDSVENLEDKWVFFLQKNLNNELIMDLIREMYLVADTNFHAITLDSNEISLYKTVFYPQGAFIDSFTVDSSNTFQMYFDLLDTVPLIKKINGIDNFLIYHHDKQIH